MSKAKQKANEEPESMEYVPQDSEFPELLEMVSDPDPDHSEKAPMTYAQLLEEKIEADAEEAKWKERKKWVSDQLLLMLIQMGVEKVRIRDGMVLKIGHGRTASTLSKTKLLELGVTVQQIQDATIEGTETTFCQIVRPKQ